VRERSVNTSVASILNPILLSKEEEKESERRKEIARE